MVLLAKIITDSDERNNMGNLTSNIKTIRESIVENRNLFQQDFYYKDEYVIVQRNNGKVSYEDIGGYENAKRDRDYAVSLAELVP